VNLDELDNRQLAIIASRARCVIGLSCVVVPSLVSRVWFGSNAPELKASIRFLGIRDLALGVGALTNLKEKGQDAEWLSMGAISDSVDGLVSVVSPGLPARARLLGLGAFGAGLALLKLSRDLADERGAAIDLA
jgi:hypothetical protein